MSNGRETPEQTRVSRGRGSAARLECRQCEVICERVVLPWRCLKGRLNCVYAFEEGEATYFGCLHKVFAPELDLAAFAGEDGHAEKRSDPYGPLRAVREPRPQCPVGIEQAYCAYSVRDSCVNPGFYGEVGTEPQDAGQGHAGFGRDEHTKPST